MILLSFLLSCDALCKILQHALSSGDKRFQEIMVSGDEIISNKGSWFILSVIDYYL